MTDLPEVRLYSVPKVAELLDCSESTAYRIIASGELKIVDIGSGGRPKTRVRSDDLVAYIDANTRRAGA